MPAESAALTGLLQRSVDRMVEKIATLGLSLVVENDFEDLRAHLAAQGAVVNPSFDPQHHDLADGFWLRVVDAVGDTVACHAERIYRTPDFVGEFIETGRLWHPDGVPGPTAAWRGAITRPERLIAGNVAYAGSMLIRTDHRGAGLSLLLPYLSRSLCLRNYATDFHTGIVRQSLAGSRVPTQGYGFPRTTLCFRGVLPGVKGPFEDVHLCWMSREEGFAKLAELPRHPRFPVELEPVRVQAVSA
jgi:hypothetical protein